MEIKCYLRTAGGVFEGQEVVYPAPVEAGRINANYFAERVELNQNVPYAAVVSALNGAARELFTFLETGHSVDVPGFGSFVLEVKGKVGKTKSGKKKIEDGKVSVRFVPDASLRESLDKARVTLASERVGTCRTLSVEAAVKVARKLIDEKGVFMQRDFALEAGVSAAYACRVLKKLGDQGLVGYERYGRAKVYNIVKD